MPLFTYRWHRKTNSTEIVDEIEAEDGEDAERKIRNLWGGHHCELGGLRVLDKIELKQEP